MKKQLILLAVSSLLVACARQQERPLTEEQLVLVKQQPIVLKSLPTDFAEPLAVHTRRQKVAAKIITSIITRSYTHNKEGTLPRERMKGVSSQDAMEKTIREGMADDFAIVQPSKILHDLLATHFAQRDDATAEQLAIRVQPVAWHLYYSEDDTFTLEYAVDMHMELPAHKIRRTRACDRASEDAYTRDEWLADNQRHIRDFAEKSAKSCAEELLRELHLTQNPAASAESAAAEMPSVQTP